MNAPSGTSPSTPTTPAETALRPSPAAVVAQARQAVALHPGDADAYRFLGRALRAAGDTCGAEQAEIQAITASTRDPVLLEAADALFNNDLPTAEHVLRPRLKENPFDVAAIRMMAELAGRLGRYADAENLLRRALELAPTFHAARSNLATVLHRQNRSAEAIAELQKLQIFDPDNMAHANLKAAVLGKVGDYDEALALYESVLAHRPDQPKIWMSYAHVLKTVGRQQDSIAAYRRALAIRPAFGEAWWSLANLKTVKFDQADITAMRTALSSQALSTEDRLHLDFALGKALEDDGDAEASFGHYAAGNALRRDQLGYQPGHTTRQTERAMAVFTPAFFAARTDYGSAAPDPIFILGMPRAGSTLIEQILSSHSQVEGTMELPDIPALSAQVSQDGSRYPEALDQLDAERVRALGEDYIERTRIQRKTGKPHFIDKLPNNWLHTGFIHLILPHARIIDARRHPLDCCFSNFKQHFAQGQSFSYGLADMGLYYRDYVRLMDHFDAVLPGRVHRVFHETLIDETEAEVRRLLDYLGLPFEPACLRFWENDRAVRTASSEQVRRPINRDGMGQWRAYEPWLDPLKQALGPVLDDYPAA